MESSATTQLPEADSLPDGFVESLESKASMVLLDERGKQLDECKDNMSIKLDILSDSSNGASLDGSVLAGGQVTLPEKHSYYGSEQSANVADEGCMEQREGHLVIWPESTSTSTASPGSDLQASTIAEKGKGGSDAGATHAKEAQISETQKSQKDTAEVKRKISKRTFKTEQEFLEFTFKYKQVLAEKDAAVAVRAKLESLCRELQRQNKLLMDECKKVSEEGQNLRLDLSTKFQDVIKDVGHKLETQKGECLSQLKENEMLREKLKQLGDQYSLFQQQYSQELQQKTLELKIAELKAQQNEEKLAQEQAQVKLYAEKISQLLETEKNLRLQLAADGEKFQQFQDALLKSNEVFRTFKEEMEKMTKLTKELEKENSFLKSKCEKSDLTLIELVEERERLKKQLEKTKNQKQKLESLCRSLQEERKQSFGSTPSESAPLQH
uniref:Alpha-taxilin n=1 Tax=Opuntia streptacantha TaxID=393608 RepID=A0A7C9D2F5_OPUST